MKKLEIGSSEHTEVMVCDEPGAGNACHEYKVFPVNNMSNPFLIVAFQNGPVKEAGVNGCHNEDLIAIVIHRLEGFQSGAFACEENHEAKTHLLNALGALRDRTNLRKSRGVEGTNVV